MYNIIDQVKVTFDTLHTYMYSVMSKGVMKVPTEQQGSQLNTPVIELKPRENLTYK